jgi:hypothetical protein
VATWITAAAVAAAIITVVAASVTTRRSGSKGVAGGALPASRELARTLPFAANLPAGYRIVHVVSEASRFQAGLTVEIASPKVHVQLAIDPPTGADRRFRTDARSISVGGRPGYFGATWTDSQYDHHNAGLPVALSWKYNGVAYASLTADYDALDQAHLQQLARRFDFTKTTPIRVGIALHGLPPGTRLVSIGSTYRELDPGANHRWETGISLSLVSSARDGINVALCRCASSDASRQDAQKRTVNGKTAYLYANGSGGADVEVDEGHGVVLHVSSTHDESGPWTGTTGTLLALARSIVVTGSPDTPSKWFDAATATP